MSLALRGGSLPTLVKDSTLAPKPCTRHLHHR